MVLDARCEHMYTNRSPCVAGQTRSGRLRLDSFDPSVTYGRTGWSENCWLSVTKLVIQLVSRRCRVSANGLEEGSFPGHGIFSHHHAFLRSAALRLAPLCTCGFNRAARLGSGSRSSRPETYLTDHRFLSRAAVYGPSSEPAQRRAEDTVGGRGSDGALSTADHRTSDNSAADHSTGSRRGRSTGSSAGSFGSQTTRELASGTPDTRPARCAA
jgi:hypothetical protein